MWDIARLSFFFPGMTPSPTGEELRHRKNARRAPYATANVVSRVDVLVVWDRPKSSGCQDVNQPNLGGGVSTTTSIRRRPHDDMLSC